MRAAGSRTPSSRRECRECLGCAPPPQEQVILLDTTAEVTSTDNEYADDNASIVQFSTSIYYVAEHEGTVFVDVVRLGGASGSAVVSYRTVDGSATDGLKYIAREGTLKFDDEETMKQIEIEICQNETWDATLEFHVELFGVKGAQMGKYLHHCMVMILDDDLFPTSKYGDMFHSYESISEIFGPSLMIEYIKMIMQNPDLLWGSIKKVLLDQVCNLHFFMVLYLQLYLVDVVLVKEGDGGGEAESRRLDGLGGVYEEIGLLVPNNRKMTAIVVGILMVVPFGINHLVALYSIHLSLAGKARKQLQANLLRRFLNYEESVRANISPGDLAMAMTRDVSEVVDLGYMKLFSVIQVIGKFSLAIAFVLSENTMAVLPLLVFPIILGLFLLWREALLTTAIEATSNAENALVHGTNEAITNFQLIRDFQLRAYTVNTFDTLIGRFNTDQKRTKFIILNNTYLAPWLTHILVGGYIIVGTFEVETLGGPLSLGTFLATINVFKEVGQELQEIYREAMVIQTAFGPLKRLTFFLNQPTDLMLRMTVNRARRKEGKMKRELARQSTRSLGSRNRLSLVSGTQFAVDTVKIELKNVNFAYEQSPAPVLKNLSVQFAQGQMYAFVGKPHQGKATLLKILGQVIVPPTGQGEAFVPPHLRILHVGREVHVLKQPFFRNIIFNQTLEQVGGWTRIMDVCKLCGFSSKMLRHLEAERSAHERGEAEAANASWHKAFAESDRARLNLARVFVMNAECLVMHLPLVAFSDKETIDMVQLMRTHIDNRGLELPPEQREFRRPRTLFFTSSALNRCNLADVVYDVCVDKGMEIIGGQQFVKLASSRDELG